MCHGHTFVIAILMSELHRCEPQHVSFNWVKNDAWERNQFPCETTFDVINDSKGNLMKREKASIYAITFIYWTQEVKEDSNKNVSVLI